MKFYKTLVYFCEEFLLKITGLVFIISTLIISYQVLGRKIFGYTITGYDQIIIWISIISIYLMLGLSLKRGQQLRVGLFVKKIKKDLSRIIVELVGTFVSVTYIVIALFSTITFMLKSKSTGSTAVMVNFPTWIVYLFISIGLLLFLIFYFERLFGFARFFTKSDKSIIETMDNDG